MKSQYKFILMITPLLLCVIISAQSQTNFILKSAKAKIQGTSSLHDWESDISKIDFKGSFTAEGSRLKEVKSVEIKILVEWIKSTKGKIMDDKTYEAFKYKENPYITYKLTSAKIITDATNTSTIDANGTLTMAGETRAIAISAKGKMQAGGDLQLTVIKKIKMTDFKMEPPTAMLGAIKVADEVTVIIDLILTQKQIAEL